MGGSGRKIFAVGLLSLASCTTNITTGGSTKVDAATEVGNCMRLHSMSYATQSQQNPSDVQDPFVTAHPDAYSNSSDPEYQSGSPTIMLFQFCVWPPGPGADQTGYSQILAATVPGSAEWPGEVSAMAYADVFDTSCPTVVAHYKGGHTGVSFSHTATVNSAGITITSTEIPSDKTPSSLSEWAKSVGYAYMDASESVILHAADENLDSAYCSS